MKKFKPGLLTKIIIAIVLGILVGSAKFIPEWFVRIFLTFNGIFSQFLGFLIPLIVVGLVTVAIADIGKSAGKMLVITVAIAYGSTLFAGFFSYFTGELLFPYLIDPDVASSNLGTAAKPEAFFTIDIPPMLNIMTALVLSFMLGLGIAFTQAKTLRGVADDFKEIIEITIKAVIIRLLPLYIFGIFLNMAFVGEVAVVLGVFLKIILVIFAVHIIVLLIQYGIAGAVSHKNPFVMLKNMLPAYFTALGTQSSAATIPVTLNQCRKNGVSDDIAGFVVPLCSTIHLSGSTLKIVACALAIMMMNGMEYDFMLFAGFIMMLGIVMVAAPGVPGGAIMASLPILGSMLGFDEATQGLMIALYIAMDSFGTACNVTGDGAIALVMDRIAHRKQES